MKDWKIGTRISAGFGVVILIAAAVGLFAINRIDAIQKSTDEIALGTVPRLFLMREIQDHVGTTMTLTYQYLTSNNPEEKSSILQKMQTLAVEANGYTSDFEKLMKRVMNCLTKRRPPARNFLPTVRRSSPSVRLVPLMLNSKRSPCLSPRVIHFMSGQSKRKTI
jgi:predicted RND superfamily exporter protein